jgi:hypothetical protein
MLEAWFQSQAVHVEFAVDEGVVGQGFLEVIRFVSLSVFPPTIHIHSIIFSLR